MLELGGRRHTREGKEVRLSYLVFLILISLLIGGPTWFTPSVVTITPWSALVWLVATTGCALVAWLLVVIPVSVQAPSRSDASDAQADVWRIDG